VDGECYGNVSIRAVTDTGSFVPDTVRPDQIPSQVADARTGLLGDHDFAAPSKMIRFATTAAGNDSSLLDAIIPPSSPSRPDVVTLGASAQSLSWKAPELLRNGRLVEYVLEGRAIVPSVLGTDSNQGAEVAVPSNFSVYAHVPPPALHELYSPSSAISVSSMPMQTVLEGAVRRQWNASLPPLVPATLWPPLPATAAVTMDLRANSAYYWRVKASAMPASSASVLVASNDSSAVAPSRRLFEDASAAVRQLHEASTVSSLPSEPSFASITASSTAPSSPSISVSGSTEGLGMRALPVQWDSNGSHTGTVLVEVEPPADMGGQSIICVQIEYA